MAPNLRSKLGMFRKFGTIDLNYCFFHSQECEKSKSDLKIKDAEKQIVPRHKINGKQVSLDS